MKIFMDSWNGRRYYNFRRVGFGEPHAFGPAWLCIMKNDNTRVTVKDYKIQLRGVWKLWGRHTSALTNEKYGS